MKLCKLKLKNLNSFRQEVDLDFESSPLGDASLVAITGPTGAGKTTLLDAICVALYGKTPRLHGTKNQHPRHLISHGETEGFAEVYFEANSKCYHATWSISGKGSPQGRLYDESGDLITTKVAQEVESILGLDFNAFRRSVMLAQGEFAAFLKASREDRRTILEATAGIHIYDILRQALNDKVNAVEAEHQEVLQKLGTIPEVSREQLTQAEAELDRQQQEVAALVLQSKEIQEEMEREAKRKEDFARLQSSEKRQTELSEQQTEIDNLEEERERAQRANGLRPEKQVSDIAKSELKDAEESLRVATTEKTEAEARVKTDQADFDKKEEAYQTASTERDRKVAVYAEAKADVERAENRFTEAGKRTPDLENLGEQIKGLSSQLDSRQTERAQLEEQIQSAQTFLDENPLPSNRQHCLNQATGLLVELGSQEKQLETVSANKAQHEKKVSSSKRGIEKLSKTLEEGLAEKTDAEATLEEASAELNALLATGTREEWNTRKQKATKAQPIAQKIESAADDLTNSKNHLRELNKAKAALDTELGQIEAELTSQAQVSQHLEEAVERCESARESALLANPINQLRQHLHAGEPCLVCGATEHPSADAVEPEDEERLQDAEKALESAKVEAQAAQEQRQALQTRQVQTQQNRRNTADQIEDCEAEIAALQDHKIAQFLAEWQEIYPDPDISSEWIVEQIKEADTAIDNLREAEQAHIQASHACQTAVQQFETCESGIQREKEALEKTEEELQDISDALEDLKTDITSTEKRFWKLLPEAFHDISPENAKEQFSERIEEVEKRKDERDSAKAKLNLLNTKIETDQHNFERLQRDHEKLRAEIDEYRREGEAFLDTVRKKTDGLETENEINVAIETLETELQSKESRRDAAQQQLQNSQKLLTQKQTTHRHCAEQYEESAEKLEIARDAYFEKLSKAGFDSPEAHDNAFRDDSQIQELTDQIDVHENEKQQLAVEITKLRTRFEETPFDPEALARIEAQVEEIGKQLQAAQLEVGAQQQKIKDLKRDLEKRESLGDEMRAAEQELKRWQRLHDTIPRNDLRDFALEIMFKQMGSIANVQLRYLTSERYQLKVEGIGDLTVIDRWNANEERPVETLSGGESFLTSLALALALADLSRGRAQLNSLFLDEGFGTLDTETLDIAIAALEGLRTQGRSIFLISHIQELTRRLPVKINVRKRGDGSSYIGN